MKVKIVYFFLKHLAAAVALWNNMMEPVPSKLTQWKIDEPIECPSPEQFAGVYGGLMIMSSKTRIESAFHLQGRLNFMNE